MNRRHRVGRSSGAIACRASLLVLPVLLMLPVSTAWALPPASEIPEEVLRAQPDLRARSPVDNQLLATDEARERQEALATRPETGSVSPQVERLVFLLRLRKGLRDLFPFLF